MSMYDGYSKAGLIFGGTGGGTTEYTRLTNKPKINGVELIDDKSTTDLDLSVIITASDNTTIDGYQVPQLTTEQVQTAYNAVISGKTCIIVDKNNWMHLNVIQADSVGDEVTITVAYYMNMLLTYVDDETIEFRSLSDSYNDLKNLPKINGVEVNGSLTSEELGIIDENYVEEKLVNKQNKLTAGTNIDITNNVISSNQPTAINPFTLSFGNEDYNGSAPKQITAAKIGAATEDFVNSSIATNTAFFKGTFNSVSALPTTGVTNNDYAFIVVYETLEPSTIKQYDRYKYSTEIDDETDEVVGWTYEYTLNNSSFTADEWATIQSGLKNTDKTQIATNTSAIADIIANMPDSPEDVNAQAKALIIKASLDEGTYDITITDERYIEEHSGGISINYEQLFADAVIAFTNETDVIFRATIDTAEGTQIVDFVCVCLAEDGTGILFEGHLLSELIVIWLDTTGIVVAEVYDVEPADSLDDADDGQLTTAKAQKEYFQTKITSSNKIPYSNISGTPTNLVKTSGVGQQTINANATGSSATDSPLMLQSSSGKTEGFIGFKNGSGTTLGYFGVDANKKPVFYDTTNRELALKSDIPTIPSNIVKGYNSSGTATAFEIRISSSEPSSGTASNIITLVTG